MSDVGQTLRFDPQRATSGPPQSTDIAGPARFVPFVPEADLCRSLTGQAATTSFQICGTTVQLCHGVLRIRVQAFGLRNAGS
jgi:hypothetical protein